ncbi:MAG: DUF6624 domain-containing protein [Dokdonella sp.]
MIRCGHVARRCAWLLYLGVFGVHADTDADRERMRRACPGFVAYVEAQQAKMPKPLLPAIAQPPPSDPQLRETLLLMQASDQAARAAVMQRADPGNEIVWHLMDVDADNLIALRVIFAIGGVPTRTQVGDDGAAAAWLLLQHADADQILQAGALDIMTMRAATDESNGVGIAMLTDRVLLAQGKPQRYGSQFLIKDGDETLRPTEDMAGLDRRREAMGLAPLADYECVLRLSYGAH